ncbi:hypothetical protein [Klebsiella pneumoniae]
MKASGMAGACAPSNGRVGP